MSLLFDVRRNLFIGRIAPLAQQSPTPSGDHYRRRYHSFASRLPFALGSILNGFEFAHLSTTLTAIWHHPSIKTPTRWSRKQAARVHARHGVCLRRSDLSTTRSLIANS